MPLRSRAAAVLGALTLSAVVVVATAVPASACSGGGKSSYLPASAPVDGKVSFCHATGSAKNPYLYLKVSSSATNAWSYTNGTHKHDLGTAGATAAGTTMTPGVDPSAVPQVCLPKGDTTGTPSSAPGGGTTPDPITTPSTTVGGTTGGTTTTPSATTGSGTTTGGTDSSGSTPTGSGTTDPSDIAYTGDTSWTSPLIPQ